MSQYLLLATHQGIWRVARGSSGWWAECPVEAGAYHAIDVAGDGSALAVGSGGLRASADGGRTWRQVADLPAEVERLTSVAIGHDDGAWYIGSEPSFLYRSRDRGRTWDELEGLRHVASRSRWSFPPRPWTHHVSAVAPHPQAADIVTAGIELGGLMRTENGGDEFADHARGAHKDCHLLCVHPLAPERVYQGAGEGTAVSNDGGATYRPTNQGLQHTYVTALAVDGRNPDRSWCASSPSAGRAHYSDDAAAALYRRGPDDGAWIRLNGEAAGLPSHFAEAVVALAAAEREAMVTAALRHGVLVATSDAGHSWKRIDALSDAVGGAGADEFEVADMAAVR